MSPFVGTNYKLLIEIGDWSLQQSGLGTPDHVGICHNECQASWMRHYAKSEGKCIDCKKKIPDEVMGAWILYNFDRYEEI